MTRPQRDLTTGLCAVALALLVGGCGEAASIGGFKGESHNVAQAVSNFQSDATAADQKKLCEKDLAAVLTTQLRSGGGCKTVLEKQLHEVDSFNMTVESVAVNGNTATARVKSTYSGKSRIATLSLVKEGSHWKISGAQG